MIAVPCHSQLSGFQLYKTIYQLHIDSPFLDLKKVVSDIQPNFWIVRCVSLKQINLEEEIFLNVVSAIFYGYAVKIF